jgi:hypothetical protein
MPLFFYLIETLLNAFLIYCIMANSGNFHSSKSNAPKIFCAWCQHWKTGHIVLKFTKGANWKIHKHSKGDKSCKGSDKIVMKKNDS